METIVWHPNGRHFLMAGRQAQGTWNAAVFDSSDGNLVQSLDTKKRITHAIFAADGESLVISGATGQPQRKDGKWPAWGRVQVYRVTV
jgi:Tol biopolymer transport system component